MSYRKVYFEWSIKDIQYGVAVGFEVEFSRDKSFREITSIFTTFREMDAVNAHKFFYSEDNGETWIQFPWGDEGKKFNKPYLMRLEVNPSDIGYSIIFSQGNLYRISADSRQLLDSIALNIDETIVDIDQYGDVVYLVGQKTLFKLDALTFTPYNNSLPLLSDSTLGVVVDESRGTFWQINSETIDLKDTYGDLEWSVAIPHIDIDYSSSSSSTSSSSSSSTSSSSSSSTSSSSSSSTSESSSSSRDSSSSSSIPNSSSSSSSSLSDTSSSSSESSTGGSSFIGNGFSLYPEFAGIYHEIGTYGSYPKYKNDNDCYLRYDSLGGISAWKLYLNTVNLTQGRDHYYKISTLKTGTYNIHMWWEINPSTNTGTIAAI